MQIGNAQLGVEPFRQPLRHVRALAARHFDRMAHLDHVELVGFQRIGSDGVEVARRGGGYPARGPAGAAADQKGGDRRCGGVTQPAAAARSVLPQQPVEFEPLRHRLAGDRAIAGADAICLRPPAGDQRGMFGMRGKPGGDRFLAVGRQFAVDIGMQFFFGYG